MGPGFWCELLGGRDGFLASVWLPAIRRDLRRHLIRRREPRCRGPRLICRERRRSSTSRLPREAERERKLAETVHITDEKTPAKSTLFESERKPISSRGGFEDRLGHRAHAAPGSA
jgi:hypothetical protein